MRCEKGYCIVCDKQIYNECPTCNTKKFTNEATDVLLNMSNGSRISMGCCTDCAKGPIWKADKKEMTEALFKAWDIQGHPYSKEIVLVD